ncbi:signal-induced proliferation-associated 1-like protein 2, partial [Sinocyclocheilus rhinocerous]|uniref:signal-induced proliferation-associated 1-like protein 2 n=1 Tax=Sinocyclocheilus rhinocerous TaxID=307959 RepID=UPI0007B83DE8
LTTLRGAILEDAVPSTARHGTARGLPLKEVLEYVVPELNIQCLRLAISSPRVPEQLLKLDEQGLSFQHKVGVLYCKAGQSTEEEMYNNENASPALDEFLDLLGQRVRLKGFTKYRAQLDNKTDSTGSHSLYTTYKDYELMFHVSTLLPYTPNNRQQLLRKRHIGNDIVTIVFQEPGALPFTPKNIRSHFQHVFVIVKVHNPCTENVCYSVAVSRSKDVPPFGPPVPKGVTFPKSAVFRDFLLAKVINGENAAHKSEKFRAMATRTRQEYLKDLAENCVSTTTVDSAVKFSFIMLGAKKKERVKPRKDAHLHSVGAITWSMVARDFGQSADVECLLGISNEFIVLIEVESKNVIFNCSCRDVIGWSSGVMSIKIFYERGECVMLSAHDNCGEDIREIVQRLEMVTRGCETTEMTLRRNGLGQLGFHVNFEGIVADVEPFGYAWKAGLRQGSRLVEICKVAVATLTHEQMIDLLRTSISVKVVIIQPYEDGAPRRGCSELYRIPMVEYKLDSEGTPCEYKTPFKRHTTWHRVPTSGQPLPDRMPCQQVLQHAQTAIPRSTSFDRKLPDGPRSVQDVEKPPISSCSKGGSSQHYRSSPSNQSSSSDPGPCASTSWSQQPGYDGCQSPVLHERSAEAQGMLGDGEMLREREPTLERTRSAEAKWHVPSTKILNSLKERGKDSPNKSTRQGGDKNSSHSSSNTLSSNASSSNSDEKHFGSGDLMDPEMLGLTYIKGASTDSGIDTAPCSMTPGVASASVARVMLQGHGASDPGHPWTPELTEEGSTEEDHGRLYLPQSYGTALATGHAPADGSMGDPSEISSHSRQLYATETSCRLQDRGRDKLKDGGQQPNMSKEEYMKMMLPEDPPGESGHRKVAAGSLSPRRSLYRTLSDESVCSNRKGSSYASSRSSMLDQAMPNDILFSSTPPYHSTLPPRISLSQPTSNLKNEFWFSDGSLADRSKFSDPGLMPLPDTATGLDWSHLVDAARAFEDQRVASFCTMTDMQRAEALQISRELTRRVAAAEGAALEAGDTSPATLTGKVNQLEVILRQLQYDLKKEKEDKAILQVEVQHLRQDNMRLQEESQTAAAQLRKFTQWFFHTIDKKP